MSSLSVSSLFGYSENSPFPYLSLILYLLVQGFPIPVLAPSRSAQIVSLSYLTHLIYIISSLQENSRVCPD